MVDVKPFRAIRYQEKAGDLAKLIAQPYDKIDATMQKEYYAQSDYNYCRLTLPIEEDRYNVARKRLEEWLNNEILKQDDTANIYVYYQEFELFGQKYIRKGFIGALRLYPFEENVVLPHEKTHKGPKIDRLNMLQTTKHTLEPGFILYNDEEKKTLALFDEVSQGSPILETVDSLGVLNKMWKLSDPEKIKIIQDVFKGQQLVVADGHHRYETACTYRDMRREEKENWEENDTFNFRMTYLVPIQDEGLIILATHRCLAKDKVTSEKMTELKKYFTIEEIAKDQINTFLETNKDKHVFVMYQDGKAFSMILEDTTTINKFVHDASIDFKNLDVVILRDMIFEGILGLGDLHIDEDIFYERWVEDAVQKVDEGKYMVSFILNPTKAEEVLNVAKNQERMPQKSTDFYPKMISGLTMMSLEDEEKLI